MSGGTETFGDAELASMDPESPPFLDETVIEPEEAISKLSLTSPNSFEDKKTEKTSSHRDLRFVGGVKYTLVVGPFQWSERQILDTGNTPILMIKATGLFKIDLTFVELNSGIPVLTIKQTALLNPTYDVYMGQEEIRYAYFETMWGKSGYYGLVKMDNGEPDLSVTLSASESKYYIHRGETMILSGDDKTEKQRYSIASGENPLLLHAIVTMAEHSLLD